MEIETHVLSGPGGKSTGRKYTIKGRIWAYDGETQISTKNTTPQRKEPRHFSRAANGAVSFYVEWVPAQFIGAKTLGWKARARLDHTGQKSSYTPVNKKWVEIDYLTKNPVIAKTSSASVT